MDLETIAKLALDCGFVCYGEDMGEYRIPAPAFIGRLERFASAVAAAVKEEDARICEERHANGNWKNDTRDDCSAAIRASIKEVK